MPIASCPKCGGYGNCSGVCKGDSIFNRSYEYTFVCKNCGYTEKAVNDGACWGALDSRCKFCGKKHAVPLEELQAESNGTGLEKI